MVPRGEERTWQGVESCEPPGGMCGSLTRVGPRCTGQGRAGQDGVRAEAGAGTGPWGFHAKPESLVFIL